MSDTKVLQLGSLKMKPIDPGQLETIAKMAQVTRLRIRSDMLRNGRNVDIARRNAAR